MPGEARLWVKRTAAVLREAAVYAAAIHLVTFPQAALSPTLWK